MWNAKVHGTACTEFNVNWWLGTIEFLALQEL